MLVALILVIVRFLRSRLVRRLIGVGLVIMASRRRCLSNVRLSILVRVIVR